MPTYQVQKTLVVTRHSTEAKAIQDNPVLLKGETWNEIDSEGRKTGRTKTGVNGQRVGDAIVGTRFVDLPFDPSGPGGTGDPTNLSITARTATGLTIASSTGTDAEVPVSTTTLAGLQEPGNRAKAEGAVQAVALTPPSGWSASSNNVGGSVALALGLPSGFSLPSTSSQANWDTAYAERLQWSGGATGLNAATGRASLGLGTAAQAATTDFATPSALATGLAAKADLVGGVVPSGQIPAIAISDYLGAVASQSAMLALTGQRGDWCLRTDGTSAGMWVLSGDNAALLANWVQIPAPTVTVQSVNGQTGIVTLGPGDVGAATAAQGTLASTAIQPAALSSTLSSYLTIANGALTYQPLDADLTAIAALTTTSYGRSALTLANAAAGRTWLELGTAATAAIGDFATPAALSAGLTGKADLVGGVVPTSQIPAIALVQYLGQVNSQAAMLALRGQGGDWCIRTDQGAEWVIVANDGALLTDWFQMPTGTAGVSSINGQTGAVTLGTGDLGESGGNLFFTAARAIGAALTGFTAGAGTVAATDSILQAFQKVVGNIANRALEGLIGSSGLTMATNRLAGRSTAGVGAVEEITPAGGLSLQSGNLVMTEGIALYCSGIGETVAARLNHVEKAVDRACTVIRVTWELAPTSPSTSGSSQAMLYARRSGIKTPLLTGNASLPVTTGIFTDVSGTLTGTLTLAAGDTLGVDLSQVGTGASGLILTAYVRYS